MLYIVRILPNLYEICNTETIHFAAANEIQLQYAEKYGCNTSRNTVAIHLEIQWQYSEIQQQYS